MRTFLFLCLLPATLFAKAPTQISFSVTGTVKNVSQAVAKFSENMVPFGDPTVAAPFTLSCSGIEPKPKKAEDIGSSRWLGPKEWAYDFKKPLEAGVRCEFVLKGGVKNLDGEAVTAAGPFGFDTGGPAIKGTRPWEGGTVDEDQYFTLELDSAVDKASVEKAAYFEIEGQGNRVGLRWITGKERKATLKSAYREDTDKVLVIAADQKFPADTKLAFVWGRGIRSRSGVATTTDQVLNFKSRSTFRAEFRCMRENVEAGCSPVGYLSLYFSSPIRVSDADKVRIRTQAGVELPRKPRDGSSTEEWTSWVEFTSPFPESTNLTVEIPSGLKDDAGRALANADKFPLSTRTDRFPPLAKFPATFGILEAGKGALLPVTVRNLEPEVKANLFRSHSTGGVSFADLEKVEGKSAKVGLAKRTDVLAWIQRIERHRPEFSIFEPQPKEDYRYAKPETKREYVAPPERVTPQAFPVPKKEKPQSFEVVGIPMPSPGFYVVEVDSRDLGHALLEPKVNFHAATAVLVTDLSVHFKWGRESSLAWVTRLKDGKPVADATVDVLDCNGKRLDGGKSNAAGVVALKKVPKDVASCKGVDGYSRFNSGLLVTADLGEDFAFVHSSMNDGIESWRYQLPSSYSGSNVMAHSVLDRTLFRAGETLHMKTFLRQHTSLGIDAVAAKDRPEKLILKHSGSDQTFEFPIKWEATGFFATEWAIPKDAKLGHYVIELTRKGKGGSTISAGSFRVEEFRVPLLSATLQTPTPNPVRPKELVLDAGVSYLSGGAASGLAVKLRTQTTLNHVVSFEEFDGFQLANGAVKVGRVKRGSDSEDEATTAAKAEVQDGVLDGAGAKRFTLKGLPKENRPYQLVTELEYPDPNGEIQTKSTVQVVYPAHVLVGVKSDSWVASKDQIKLSVAVAGLDGKPAANRKVQVALFEKKTYSHRKRLVGGYYAYENTDETKKLGDFCEGETNARGLLICEAKPPQSGNLIAEARSDDGQGNQSYAYQEIWVPGSEEWWFSASDNDRMDLIPERKRYEPGERAKIQVRVPFREATLLVTVEREGILETFVQTVTGKSPVIEVPIQPRYAPNAFISVLAVRGRSGEAQPTALVDLGKPAYKLGITQVDVGWARHELNVKVATPKPVYRIREQVPVEVLVADTAGKPMKNADVTLAAVDEGLLSLMPNDSWDLLTAMLQRRPYEIETATASMLVIGKRHFGLKALPAGGGGGEPTRELFDTLLFWRASLKTDDKGRATAVVPLNDSLTSFRIVAIASAGLDKFGTGRTNVRSNQDLMLFSGVSPLAREGDRTEALLTLRNTTEKPFTVQAHVSVEGLTEKFPAQKVELKGGESKVVAWQVSVPQGKGSLKYTFEASSPQVSDRMQVTQKVVQAVPLRVYQAGLAQVDKDVNVPIERPQAAIAGRGGISVNLQPTLLAGLKSIQAYMSEYPFTCLEQETSRAVALQDAKLWAAVVKSLPVYQDGQGFLKYFPTMREGSEILTAYFLSVASEAGWEIPETPKENMIAALQGFAKGTASRFSGSPAADLVLRKISALEALSRFPNGVAPEWLKAIEFTPNLWPTSALIEYRNVLARTETPLKATQWKEVNTILRSRMNTSGTALSFSTEKGDSLWWLMASADTNSVRTVLSLVDDPEWRDEVPRILRGAVGRQQRGHWDLTLANAWGVLALKKFAKAFEAGTVEGTTNVALAPQTVKKTWLPNEKDTFELPWPSGKGVLEIRHAGKGKPWAIYQSIAAIPLKDPLSAGFRLEKTVTPLERKVSGKWSVGDVVRITLKVSSDADQAWVAVNDPIPAGASLLGGGLGNTSALLTQGEKEKGSAWPIFTERSFEGLRAYYEWVNQGDFVTEYTVRLNQAGAFQLPATRVEAMYRPEAFGELPNSAWEIVR